MNLVLYSLGNKYFNFPGNPLGTYIQASDGLFDELKPKNRTQFDWPDRNGIQISTLKSTVYNPREINLKGWIEGLDWLDIKTKFDTLFSPFRTGKKVRLTITPFNSKTLIYDVLTTDEISFDKKFKDGEMIGFFNLKLVEFNPVKKIFKTTAPNLIFKGYAGSPIEMILGSSSEMIKGDININRTLIYNTVSAGYPGQNIIRDSKFQRNNAFWGSDGLNQNLNTGFPYASLKLNSRPEGIYQVNVNLIPGESYTLSFETKAIFQNQTQFLVGFSLSNTVGNIPSSGTVWTKSSYTFVALSNSDNLLFYGWANGRNEFLIRNVKVEKAKTSSPYRPAPEDEIFISLAGNLEDLEITEINADLEWVRL